MNNVNVKYVKVIVTVSFTFFARKSKYTEESRSYLKQRQDLNKVKFDMFIEYGQMFWTIKYFVIKVGI